MLKKLDKGLIISILASLFSGALIFILLYGFEMLNPANTNWIIDKNWEISQHYTGWIFFRKAGWTFPIGLFDSLSYPVNTSIVNTDSIPIFAIIFKLLSPILPENFQYFGIFGLICYSLQSLLGMILVRKYAGNLAAVLSGILFALIPGLTLKMLIQTSLSAMWLILLALIPIVYSDELKLKHKIIIYSLTGFLASLIHPYYIVMCGIIAFADSVYEICITKKIWPLLKIIFYSLFAIINMYILGVFQMHTLYLDKLDIMYLFISRTAISLSSFINPKLGEVCDEPYCAYLGWGIMLLVSIAVISKVIKRNKVFNDEPKMVLYGCLIALSIIIAFSPVVRLNPNFEIITIKYPEFVLTMLTSIRFIARIVFIANNIILLLAIIYCVKTFEKKAIYILLACILLQLHSVHNLEIQKSNLETSVYGATLFNMTENIWDEIFEKNDIKTIYFEKNIMARSSNRCVKIGIVNLISKIGKAACEHNVNLNHFYFAKTIQGRGKIYNEALNNPDSKNLLIFLREGITEEIIKKIPDNCYIVDNLILVRSEPIIGLEKYKVLKKKLLLKSDKKNSK